MSTDTSSEQRIQLRVGSEAATEELARKLGYSDARLRRHRGNLMARGKAALTRARRVPFGDRRAIRHSPLRRSKRSR